MKLISLSLEKFRNYPKSSFVFERETTVIVGDNARGKTNILEAIYLMAIGKSFRATKEEQMILYGQEVGWVRGEVELNSESIDLEIRLTVGEVAGQRVQKKRYLVNNLAKRKMDFVGKLKCVLFRPENIELVLGSPSVRRDYLNQVLEQINEEYRRSLLAYSKGVRQRNKLLESIREKQAERKQLLFWDKLLIKNGQTITEKRREYIECVNKELKEREMEISLKYEFSAISESKLENYAEKEIWAGKTLVGPHRDDFVITKKREGKMVKDLSIYGSRGEQRMAILGIKLAELEFMTEDKERPVLLLDDVFSELDKDHRKEVLNLIGRQQTIMTTANEEMLSKRIKTKMQIISLD